VRKETIYNQNNRRAKTMAKKYRCTICGQIVEVEEGEPCPICGADFSLLVPVDENGNDIEK